MKSDLDIFNEDRCLMVKITMGDDKEYMIKQQLSDKEVEAIKSLIKSTCLEIIGEDEPTNKYRVKKDKYGIETTDCRGQINNRLRNILRNEQRQSLQRKLGEK